jgi:ABC-type polysaccharide/polyol phosphate export permease
LCISLLDRAKIGWVFFRKDFNNTYRFKSALIGSILNPFLSAVSLFVTYSAVFFVGGVEDIAFVNKQNYVIYLMSGFLALNFARTCWGATALRWEKIMMTLDGMFLAPVGRLWILFGKSISVLFSISLSSIPYVLILLILGPRIESYVNLVLGIISLFLMMAIFLSVDFVVSAISLSEEGYAGIIRTWVPRAISLLSCVYYPPEVFPEVFRPIVYLNPAYHGVNLFRSAFMENGVTSPWFSFLYLLTLGVVLPPLCVRIFESILGRFGIRGY